MEDEARDDEVDEGGVSKAERRKLKAATHYHVAKICEEEGGYLVPLFPVLHRFPHPRAQGSTWG